MSALSLHQLKQKSLLAFDYRLFSLIGRDGGIRTHDLQHPMLARYRATLHPV